MNTLILLVEDDEHVRDLVKAHLIEDGYTNVHALGNGDEAFEFIKQFKPGLVILDWMLPGKDGKEICTDVKANPEFANIPVVMLTAKSQDDDEIEGLEFGADDYITKPFEPKVLMARIKAILRRSQNVNEGVDGEIRYPRMVINIGRNEVVADGVVLDMTFSEFQMLLMMAKRPGWVFSRELIVEGIHGENYAVTDRAVDVQIFGLRKKLGECGRCVETVRGVGYKFTPLSE